MKTEILIISYLHDLPYLEYALRSIHKFAAGFSGVTLVVPQPESDQFLTLAAKHDCKLRTHTLPGHLGAQAQKCLADLHCPDSDFIAHLDSDCIFTEPVQPDDYFVDGKPVMVIEAFSRLPPNHPWKPTVDRALGIDATYETMRRHPQVNLPGVYRSMRNRVEFVHGITFLDYVMSQKPDFPWGFSEHCTLGAFAYGAWHEQYHWIDLASQPMPRSKLMQFWSHAPIDQPQDLPSGGRGCPLAEFQRLVL